MEFVSNVNQLRIVNNNISKKMNQRNIRKWAEKEIIRSSYSYVILTESLPQS